MLTILGLFTVVSLLAYFFILRGRCIKEEPNGLKMDLFPIILFALTVGVAFLGGVFLAIQIGKNLPTYQKKIGEVEYITTDDSEDVFVVTSYELTFVNGKHFLIGIPSVNGGYGITKKITKKKEE